MNSTAIKKISWTAGLGAGVVAALILFFCDPIQVPIYPQCLFHQVTGLDCPGCGTLRALHALLHGNIVAALRFNAFLILSLPLFSWLAGALIRRKARGETPLQIKPRWLWIYLAAFVIFGIARDLPVPLFATFAP